MAYRDPLTAARAELEKAQELIAELEARVTPELVAELPGDVAESLSWIREQASDQPATLDGIGRHIDTFREYQRLLDDVIERAPKLERSLNHLPRAFPDGVVPTHRYAFPDIYDPRIDAARHALHRAIKEYDAEATLRDARAKYFDQQVQPYVVDASFRAEKAPLRLLVSAVIAQDNGRLLIGFSLFMRTRRSTPAVKLRSQGVLASVAAWLGMRRDVVLGDPRVDDALVIDGDPEEVARLMTPAVREAVSAFASSASDASVVTGDAVARVEWLASAFVTLAFTSAVDLMVAIRRVPPVLLLMKRP